jgi:hypothetical protein
MFACLLDYGPSRFGHQAMKAQGVPGSTQKVETESQGPEQHLAVAHDTGPFCRNRRTLARNWYSTCAR